LVLIQISHKLWYVAAYTKQDKKEISKIICTEGMRKCNKYFTLQGIVHQCSEKHKKLDSWKFIEKGFE
jgi:hypothetical protein